MIRAEWALIGGVVSEQSLIVQYLVDHRLVVNTRTKRSWSPLTVAGRVFFANAKQEFPQSAEILRKTPISR